MSEGPDPRTAFRRSCINKHHGGLYVTAREMSNDDRKVAAIAKKIRGIYKSYNSNVYEDLHSMAPDPLPEEQPVEIRIGLDYYSGPEEAEISYVNYLRGAVFSYLTHFTDKEIDAPEAQSILESMEGFPWGRTHKYAGTNFSGTEHVYVGWLPASVRYEADKELGRFINDVIDDSRFEALSSTGSRADGFSARLSSICDRMEKGETRYKATVLHEITHYLIKTETEIGEMEGMTDIGDIFGATPQVQEHRVGNNHHLRAIDEAFAYFISDIIMQKRSDWDFSGYKNPSEISLVHDCLHQEVGFGNLEAAIKLDVRTFEKIAQKGQAGIPAATEILSSFP